MDGNSEQRSECPGCRKLAERVEQLERMIEQLQKALEESRRAGKRQAAPFRRKKVPAPKTPGRKAGDEYGQQSRRCIPEQIDERYEVPLPANCPECGCGELITDRVRPQCKTRCERDFRRSRIPSAIRLSV